MIDSLLRSLAAAEEEELPAAMAAAANCSGFGLCTLHRPSNVDQRETLAGILAALSEIAEETPLFLPIHPRTRARIESFGLQSHLKSATAVGEAARGIFAIEPLSYLQMLCAQRRSSFVLTDSGGLQEETTVLGVPCVTIRENTERPITITEGTNVLAGTSRDGIVRGLREARRKVTDGTRTPEFWDGRAGERIVADIVRRCGGDRERRAVA
jgi:UDP-N-acetylglucosamine 2-epimerase (non-hydrolysing)